MDVGLVCCQAEVSAWAWSLVQKNPTDCGVSECDREASIVRRPWPTRGCCVIHKKTQQVQCTAKPGDKAIPPVSVSVVWCVTSLKWVDIFAWIPFQWQTGQHRQDAMSVMHDNITVWKFQQRLVLCPYCKQVQNLATSRHVALQAAYTKPSPNHWHTAHCSGCVNLYDSPAVCADFCVTHKLNRNSRRTAIVTSRWKFPAALVPLMKTILQYTKTFPATGFILECKITRRRHELRINSTLVLDCTRFKDNLRRNLLIKCVHLRHGYETLQWPPPDILPHLNTSEFKKG